MAAFNPNHVVVGPGTLYAAPLGTTEPTAITGAWPAGWTSLGYTDTGSDFDFKPTMQPLEVEEELWPLRQVPTTYEGSLTFALAESTQQNIALVLNAGVGTGLAGTGTNTDGSLWVETPAPGLETRIMLGWDALPEASTSGSNAVARLIVRQALQTGQVKRQAAKGSKKSVWACTFTFEKPQGVQPFRWIVPSGFAS